jgi:GNAT superfamily N-acetyltransferase
MTAPTVREWRRGEFVASTDPARLDVDAIHAFLSERSYWAQGIPLETVRRSIEHSLTIGVHHGDRMIAFARVVTDYSVIAYLADVFVLEDYRGRGLGKWLVELVTTHPDLQNLRRWLLATRDAHTLYGRFGFQAADPTRLMDKLDPDVYRRR